MISTKKQTTKVSVWKKIKYHQSHSICFVYILVSLCPKTKNMQSHFAPEHTPKDNELSLNSNELTQKDLPDDLLFYIKDFEIKLFKKIIVQKEKHSRIVISPNYVETFLQIMATYYKNICIIYPHMNYPVFSDLIYHYFALCQKRYPDRFLSYSTILTYFKQEMADGALSRR